MTKRDDLDVPALVEAYQRGVSAEALAQQWKASVWAVLARLRKAGVQIRKPRPEKRVGFSTEDFNTFRSVVDGLLLGDGSIGRKGELRLEQCDRRIGWVQQVAGQLAAVGVASRIIPLKPKRVASVIDGRTIYPGSSSLLYTPCYVEMQEERRRWYPKGVKIVPRDLQLDSLSLTHWFCGDGSYRTDGVLVFYTQGFDQASVFFLSEALNLLGVTSSVAPRHHCPAQLYINILRKADAVRLRSMVLPHMPECCLYKLRYVRPVKQRGYSRKLTSAQEGELGALLRQGVPRSEIASHFGISLNLVYKTTKRLAT